MIVNEEQRRAMEFIAAVTLGGYRPTGREINQWRLQPEPKDLRKGRLISPEVPEVPEHRVRTTNPLHGSVIDNIVKSHNMFTNNLQNQVTAIARSGIFAPNSPVMRSFANQERLMDAALGVQYRTVPGRPGKPAVHARDRPAEKFLAHLRRLGWIERDSRQRYGLTLLGQALLAAEAIVELCEGDPSVIALATEDQKLGYGQVLGRISTMGDTLILDHYLGTSELMHLLEHTDASRFLIGPKLGRSIVTELKLQINVAPPNEMGNPRELKRFAFHDRYFVGEHKVYTLTASLNGVGKSMAVLNEQTDVAAQAIRAHAEGLWNDAEPLAKGPTAEEWKDQQRATEEEAKAEAVASDKMIREDGDRFLHEGCDVRHRTRGKAENCTNGSQSGEPATPSE